MAFQPRGRDVVIGGIPWLARMIDKAQASSSGTIEDYVYPCPMDQRLLTKLGLSGKDFAKMVAEATDEEIIAKVKPLYKED